MRRPLVCVATLALALVLPTAAAAETRYVAKGGSDSSNCADGGAPCATIGYAVGQSTSGDTIRIGEGSFIGTVSTELTLSFVGEGGGNPEGAQAKTVVRGSFVPSSSGLPAFELPNGGLLEGLRAEGGGGDNGIPYGERGGPAVEYSSAATTASTLRLQGVVAVGGDGGFGTEGRGTGAVAVDVDSGPGPVSLVANESELAGGIGFGPGDAIDVAGSGASASLTSSRLSGKRSGGGGITVYEGAAATLEAVDVDAPNIAVAIYDGSLKAMHSRLHSEGAAVYASPYPAEAAAAVQLLDSLITSGGTSAVDLEAEEGTSSTMSAVGSTFVGHGLGAIQTKRAENAGPLNVTLRNSIARVLPIPGYPSGDLYADGGSITADFSSFSTRLEENGGSVTAPGSGSNVAGDPGFIDERNGVYVLANTSPLIDRGDPGAVAAGELDLAGAPRSLDGNRDCVAAPDLGAFEVIGQSVECPGNPPPVVSGFGMTNRVFAPKGTRSSRRRGSFAARRRVKRGTKFTFTLSEPARVAIAVERSLPGRRVKRGGKRVCAAPRSSNRKAPRCRRTVAAGKIGGQKGAGGQSVAFSGRVRGKPLKPGSYRARIVATDSAGQSSRPLQLTFKVVRG